MRVRGRGTSDEFACDPIDQQMDMQIFPINRMIIFSRFEIRLPLENTPAIPREY